jgi:hypothetical protein
LTCGAFVSARQDLAYPIGYVVSHVLLARDAADLDERSGDQLAQLRAGIGCAHQRGADQQRARARQLCRRSLRPRPPAEPAEAAAEIQDYFVARYKSIEQPVNLIRRAIPKRVGKDGIDHCRIAGIRTIAPG